MAAVVEVVTSDACDAGADSALEVGSTPLPDACVEGRRAATAVIRLALTNALSMSLALKMEAQAEELG